MALYVSIQEHMGGEPTEIIEVPQDVLSFENLEDIMMGDVRDKARWSRRRSSGRSFPEPTYEENSEVKTMYQCKYCDRVFSTTHGRQVHTGLAHKEEFIDSEQGLIISDPTNPPSIEQVTAFVVGNKVPTSSDAMYALILWLDITKVLQATLRGEDLTLEYLDLIQGRVQVLRQSVPQLNQSHSDSFGE